jgi:colicin import membrane protein
MITRILLLALATTVVGLNAQEAPTTGGEKPKREGRGQGGQGGERKEGFPGLTAEEQTKVKAALEAVKEDPAVVAAKEAAKTAGEALKAAHEAGKTKEESADLMKAAMEARKAAMEATFAAAVAKDPSIKDLLDKVKANFGKRKEGAQGGQGGESPRKGGRKGEAPAEAPAAK